MRWVAALVWFAVVAWALPPAAASPAAADEIAVQVRKDHSTYEISVDFRVPASVEQTWDVLADFDHMAQILSNVDSSRIVTREGNRLTVAQTTHGHVGPVQVSVDGLRSMVLTPPTQIRSHLIKGDLKASDFTTDLRDEGAATHVVVRGTITVASWLGLVLSAERVAAQTRQQYQELRDEVLRRKAH